jgi:hypothetical protein
MVPSTLGGKEAESGTNGALRPMGASCDAVSGASQSFLERAGEHHHLKDI